MSTLGLKNGQNFISSPSPYAFQLSFPLLVLFYWFSPLFRSFIAFFFLSNYSRRLDLISEFFDVRSLERTRAVNFSMNYFDKTGFTPSRETYGFLVCIGIFFAFLATGVFFVLSGSSSRVIFGTGCMYFSEITLYRSFMAARWREIVEGLSSRSLRLIFSLRFPSDSCIL